MGLRDTEEELSSFKKSSRVSVSGQLFLKDFFFDVDLFLVVIESVTILFLVSVLAF